MQNDEGGHRGYSDVEAKAESVNTVRQMSPAQALQIIWDRD